MAHGTLTATIYNTGWIEQGSFTSVITAGGSFKRNHAGDGDFVFPIYDTPANDLVQYNRIAVVTVEDRDGIDRLVCAFHIQSISPNYSSSGNFTGFVKKVSGPGILAELQWDNIGYTTISNGSQGPTTTWFTQIMTFAQNSWTIDQIGTSLLNNGYLQAAGESVWDALLECAAQSGRSIAYAMSAPLETSGNYGRRFHVVLKPLAGSIVLKFDELNLIQAAGAYGSNATILGIEPIEDNNEVATRVTVYGAGIGADVLTIADAQGAVTVPTGFSVDWTTSTITNDTLEAVTDQPVVHRVKQFGHIKPEDNENTTAVQTAAVQLFWAGINFLYDRQAERRFFYRVKFIGDGEYMTGQKASLAYSEMSPIDGSGAANETSVIDIDDDFIVHEIYTDVPTSGAHRGERIITMLLGPEITADTYVRSLPTDEEVTVQKLKEHDEILRHATASYSPSDPGGEQTYASYDASYVVITHTANLTNERTLAGGDGIDLVDGGGNNSVTLNVDSTVVRTDDLHDAVTLGAGSDPILTLSDQELTLGNVATQTELNTHTANASAHHARYTDAETDARIALVTDQELFESSSPTFDGLLLTDDLTVGSNVLLVDHSQGNVGINRAPDSQFALDVNGPARASLFIGPHAIQLADALMICHYDGPQPYATDTTGDATGHMGQVATEYGTVEYLEGKFGKAVKIITSGGSYLTYSAAGNLYAAAGTISFWWKPTDLLGGASAIPFYNNSGSSYLLVATALGQWRARIGSTALQQTSGETIVVDTWYHVCLTWDGSDAVLYIDGVEKLNFGYTGLVIGSTIYCGLASSSGATGLIDDLAITGTAMTADEVRAIYESNAPVFAETSNWTFRSANSLVWGDSEGLWVRNADGDAAFGVSGVDSKSWGGLSLDAGDVLIGRDPDGYVKWDDSTAVMSLKGSVDELSIADGVVMLDSDGITIAPTSLETNTDDAIKFGSYGSIKLTRWTSPWAINQMVIKTKQAGSSYTDPYISIHHDLSTVPGIRLDAGTSGGVEITAGSLKTPDEIYIDSSTYRLRRNGTHIEWYNGSTWVQLD